MVDTDQPSVLADHLSVGAVLIGGASVVHQKCAEGLGDKVLNPHLAKRNPERIRANKGSHQCAAFRPEEVGPVGVTGGQEIGTAPKQGFLLGR